MVYDNTTEEGRDTSLRLVELKSRVFINVKGI